MLIGFKFILAKWRSFTVLMFIILLTAIVEAWFANNLINLINSTSMETSEIYEFILSILGKFFLTMLLLNFQAKLSYQVQYGISLDIAKQHVQGIQEKIHSKRSDFLRRTLIDVEVIAGSYILPILILFSELFITIVLIGYLSIAMPLNQFSVIVIMIILAVICAQFVRRPLLNIANNTIGVNEQRSALIPYIYDSIIRLHIYGNKHPVFSRLAEQHTKLVALKSSHTVLTNFPRLMVETTVFISIALMVLQSKDFAVKLEVLSVLGVIGLRLLPNLNRILNSLNQIRFAATFIDDYVDILGPPRNPHTPITTFSDSNHALKIIDSRGNVHQTVQAGQNLRISGKSGTGKTTFMLQLVNAIKPGNKFDFSWNEKFVKARAAHKVFYIDQHFAWFPGSVAQNIELYIHDTDEEIVLASLKANNLHIEPLFLQRNVESLSGGERQKLALSLAELSQPKFLFLDEATNAMADQEAEFLVNRLCKHDRLLVMISHQKISMKNQVELSL